MMNKVNVELLYFDGCPSWQSGLQNLRSALKANGLDVSVELVQVMDNDDAARRKFLGSPSFRINGQQVFSWMAFHHRMGEDKGVIVEGSTLLGIMDQVFRGRVSDRFLVCMP
jgi:hypothetical protein